MSPTLADRARLVAAQHAVIACLAVAAWLSPFGAWGAWLPALGLLLGAYLFGLVDGRRGPNRLARPRLKALSLAAGAVFGVVCAACLAAVAVAVPDQIDLPPRPLVAVSALVAVMLGLAGTALTLCGLDLAASKFSPTNAGPPEARRE